MTEKAKYDKIAIYKAITKNEEQMVSLMLDEYLNKTYSLDDFKSLLKIIGWNINDEFSKQPFDIQKKLAKIGGNL